MVLTRLCGPLSRINGWQRPGPMFPRLWTRFASASASRKRPGAAEEPTNATRKRKRVKKFSDLPEVYIGPTGVPATPLPEWLPGYNSLQPITGPSAEPTAKPARKTRTKKTKKECIEPDGKEGQYDDTPSLVSKAPKPTTFLSREILSNLKRFPHCLLLTRIGQFYESYFDQAVEISHLLNIKLTSRKWNGERVAMCGFPLIHLDRHLKTLVQQEKRFVALCEEFRRHTGSTSVKGFDRRITRIVTPGTLIDESFLNPLDNNYLLALSPSSDILTEPVGLAWIDVSTGEFFSKRCALENIPDELARLAPREIVLECSFQKQRNHPIFSMFGESDSLVSYTSHSSESVASTHLSDPLQIDPNSTIHSPEYVNVGLDTRAKAVQARISTELLHELESMTDQETCAIGLLTKFLKENLLEHMPLLTSPRHEDVQERLQIDSHTIQGLEIRESGHDGSSKGSLLSVVKRTITSGGARLLARWLCSPSTSVSEIYARQSIVAFFHGRTHFRTDICEILKEIDDVSRLCQRFLLGRADFGDLVAIHTTIGIWTTLKRRCEHEKAMEATENPLSTHSDDWDCLDTLFLRIVDLSHLSERISNAIAISSDMVENSIEDEAFQDIGDEERLDTQSPVAEKGNKKWSINPNSSEKLADLNTTLQELLQQKETLERELQLKYDAPSLTLRSSPGQGMFVHMARARRDKVNVDLDPAFYSIGETMTTKSYFHRDWIQLGNKITETRIALHSAEREVFDMLRLEVIEHSHHLRQNAQIIDELDVAISFALLAVEMNFVRPKITNDGSYNVVNGRHPSVEIGLLSSGRQYTPNSVDMTPSSNLHIITGPNMAGKSTFLRQTALIAILAQVGSFVPADSAHIGIVDKLFSRIGAKDDLFRDRSTFMVEMLETADILRRATEKSLVIMDEVGRGTTVKDGLAIAFAAVHHIITVNRSRCLFATHFHELAEMLGADDNLRGSGAFQNIRFYCSDVDDAGDGHFTYSYRLRPGINRDSHGLKVARLAGVPPPAMAVATDTLTWLREQGKSNIQQDHDKFLLSTLKSVA